ncbi:hypothetical protein G3567_04495 [Psychroflexus sp. YR1-1]|uniref:Uncharacterized protein n=1 Tax=Psychroflexus aurantiacus TaxID=2709310 RepID=A0A6B3R1S9_9FLAO|nr:hypothetical protein [Psychroflexus aurantiacus]NEV93410.1 hypothetical protein [Psychroflexus aurantiacus]
MNLEDIENDSFLTQANLESDTVDDFFESLKEDEATFRSYSALPKPIRLS